MSENVSNMLDHNKLFDGSYPAIARKKMSKTNIIGHFSSRTSLRRISDKILLDKNVTYRLHFLSKNGHNRGIITLSNVSNPSFSDCFYFSSFKFFNVAFPSFENFKLQAFRKCITCYACLKSTSI